MSYTYGIECNVLAPHDTGHSPKTYALPEPSYVVCTDISAAQTGASPVHTSLPCISSLIIEHPAVSQERQFRSSATAMQTKANLATEPLETSPLDRVTKIT